MTQASAKKSDLCVRSLSAVVMFAVAGTALWLGGLAWTVFVAAVALGVLWEWWGLSCKIAARWWSRSLWLLAGAGYVGVGAKLLNLLNGWYPGLAESDPTKLQYLLVILLSVILTDVGAYFAGRTLGGPKILPRISPSKTWSGLSGGAVASGLLFAILYGRYSDMGGASLMGFVIGVFVAILAQTGDFLESWMKRRAGVKDSGNLIPGHGGLFDRVDGLLAVCFVAGVLI
jgi:phosphatidate cytidylyltransferase